MAGALVRPFKIGVPPGPPSRCVKNSLPPPHFVCMPNSGDPGIES